MNRRPATISERLRTEVNISSSTVSPLRLEAADVIDALVALLEESLPSLECAPHTASLIEEIKAALAKAR